MKTTQKITEVFWPYIKVTCYVHTIKGELFMKKRLFIIATLAFIAPVLPCQAWENIGIEPLTPLRHFQDNSPNYNNNYYNQTYDIHSSSNERDDYNDAPDGNDIRDYNPYYDRYGNLKPFGDR